MAEDNSTTTIDYNRIIADVVVQNEERWLKGLKNTLLDKYKKAGIRFSYAFEQYLTRAYEKYSKVKTILYRNEPRDLYDFFVCSSIVQKSIGRKDSALINCSSAQNLMNVNKYLTILGSGGTGKSILMKHLFINALFEKRVIPIFAELRNFSESESIETFLYRIVNDLGFSLEIDYFKYALECGSFLILLDGYDEMPTAIQKNYYKKIDNFCDRYPRNYIIISSRPCDDFYGWHRFSVYNTMPLTKEKAIELVTRIDYDAEIKQKFLARLESDLFSSHESFASNPLLLSIMLMTFDNFADIPQKRHIFYSNAFDTLYSIHDATKGGYKRNLKSHLSSQEFKKVFSCFCFISYLGATTEFSRDKLNSYLDAVVNKPASFDKDAFIDDLTSSVCLIYIEGTNYIFTHKSFQEYFAALYLLQMNDEEQKNASTFLLENCENTLKTDSVFEMLSDMNPDRFEQNFVLPLLQQICSLVPEDCTDNRKIFQAFINKIIITSIKNLHHISDSEFEHIFILPLLGFEKTDNLIYISFKKGIHPNFLFFLGTHYNEKADFQITINKNHKLPTKYFAKEYQASAVANDPTLFNYVMNIYLVNTIVTTPIPLLKQIKDRQEQKKNDETKLFMRFLSIGSDD